MLSFSLCTESAVAKITYISHLVALDFNKLAWGEGGYLFFLYQKWHCANSVFHDTSFSGITSWMYNTQWEDSKLRGVGGGGSKKGLFAGSQTKNVWKIMVSRLRLIGSGRDRILMRLTDSRKMTKNSAVRREKLQILTVCCKKKIKLWKIMMTTMDSKEI